MLDAAAAKALAAIIVLSTQGASVLNSQLPLTVENKGDAWLVKGTPYTDAKRQSDHVMFHVFLRKSDGEVTGLDFEARMMLPQKVMEEWRRRLPPADYSRIFGPPTRFEPDGIRDIVFALYGGVVNKATDAADYAYVLMQTSQKFASISKSEVVATERDDVWHVNVKGADVMSFSRANGKILSGDL